MKIWRLLFKEILYRKLGFILGLISVAVAVACLIGSLTLLKIHDLHTQEILQHKQAQTEEHMAKLNDDMRKAMLKLGLNLAILPKEQNINDWYADDTGTTYMSEEYVDKLADSGIVTVRHLLPNLQHKIKWPEQKRTIILIGTRGEVPNLHKSPRSPIVQPVPKGTIVLGYELHQSLCLDVGDKVELMGREYTVHRCHDERGNKDDITAWIYLTEAQELLDKKGLINSILALHCLCKGTDVSNVRSDITHFLPDTKVLELGTERRLARAEARMKVAKEAKESIERDKNLRLTLRQQREQFSFLLVAVVVVASGIWIGSLAFNNVRQRRSEIGIFRAIGFKSFHIFVLFLSKAILFGFWGGIFGFIAGLLIGREIGLAMEGVNTEMVSVRALFVPTQLLFVLVLAVLLSATASWLPSIWASRQDPAEILRKDV